jgi:two-component system, OmpR family, sensor histidine kinase CreC
MKLGIRLLFAFFVLNGLAAFFVLRVFTAEIKPSVREVMEDLMVDTANILAEIASDDVAAGQLDSGRFATHVRNYANRPIDAQIWGMTKQSLDFRVYVTDAKGVVLFDSMDRAQGQDYSTWRDVARTLRGQYGARATREVQTDDRSSVMYVAAPIRKDDLLIGVLTVAKPVETIQRFIDRAEHKVFVNGLLLLALSAAVGVAVTLWLVYSIRKLRRYALSVQTDTPLALPDVPGELGELAQAMQAMRLRLDGREYIEAYVRALTHELKSPIAAIAGAAELLQDDLPTEDRHTFATQITQQTGRLQSLVDRMMDLTRLEQRDQPASGLLVSLTDCVRLAVQHCQARAHQKDLRIVQGGAGATGLFDADLVVMALTNLLDNAIDFSPAHSQIDVHLDGHCVRVSDTGPGVPDYAFARLGERFFTTLRPNGERAGSGLGLAIVAQIMRLHRGRLHFEQRQPGLAVVLDFSPTL